MGLVWIALLGSPALANEVPAFQISSFGPRTGVPLAGNAGWVGGYARDRWLGNTTAAYTMTDDSVFDSGGTEYGSGWAADNWLIRGEPGRNVRVRATGYNEDDDFLGLVVRHSDPQRYYLVGLTADAAPPPIYRVNWREPTLLVYKIDGPEAQVLLREPIDQTNVVTLEIIASEGTLDIRAGTHSFQFVDPDPLPAGQVGFYGYDTGFDGGGFGNTNAWFTFLALGWLDRDGDGVPDDIDNCPDHFNPDQRDSTGDGIGDACTPEPDPDPDPGPDPDPDPDPQDSDASVTGGCSSAPAPLTWAALLGALALLRRRATARSSR